MKWFILFNWIQSKVWHVFCHRLWHNLGITVVENLRKTYSTVVCLIWFEQNKMSNIIKMTITYRKNKSINT
jgi:hypothetical protein